jgi:Protein of unknown function (DUF2510)
MSNSAPAGWYPDQQVPGQQRYWDGVQWTSHTAPDGQPTPQPTEATAGTGAAAPIEKGLRRLTTPQRVSAISMIAVALAAFMPWASIFGISKAGIEGDGVITLIFAIIGAVVLSFSTGLIGRPRSPGRLSQIVLLVLAGLVALIGLLDMSGVAAIGLYLTFFAGVAWVVAAIWQLTRGKGSNAPAIG